MTNKVFDVRGTHGSGKSHVARDLIARAKKVVEVKRPPITYQQGGKKLFGYILDDSLFVIGDYTNQCGGCDGIKTQDEVKARVSAGLRAGLDVMLEGILVAHTFQPWVEFSVNSGAEWNFIVLTTDVEECVRRVSSRRVASGSSAEFNEENLRRDHGRIDRMYLEFLKMGLSTHLSTSEEAASLITRLRG